MNYFLKFSFFFAFIFSISSLSQENNYAVILIPEALKKDANAVVRNHLIEVNISATNKMVVYEKKVVTVLNKSGNQDAGIWQNYDNDTKITKLSAKIYDAYGNQIKKYKSRNFEDVSAVDGGTLYSDSRVKYVNYTPVSYPYTLVFESEYKTSSTGFIPTWFPINGYYVSVEKATYSLINPTRIPWRQKEINFENFAIEKVNSDTGILYTMRNEKAYKYENSSIASRETLPKVVATLNTFNLKGVDGTYTNWNEFGKWMYEKLLVGRNVLDESTQVKIKNLVKEEDNPIEKAKLIYEFVQNKTRYISVQVGIGGWEPIAANIVDNVGYGDCKGLTNYTKALLDVVGVTSYYTVVYAKDKRNIDANFASIQGNHIILNIPNKGNDIWLECTSQTMPFGFLGDFTDDRNVLVVTPEGGIIKRTPAYKNETNLQTIKGEIQLEESGNVTAQLQRVSKGIQYDDKYFYESFTQKELIKHYKSNVWGYNNNLEIESVTLKNDKENIVFTEDLEISLRDYATVNDTELLFRVNVFNKESAIPKRYRDRKLPLKISRGYKDIDTVLVKIPANYQITILPETKEITSKFGKYKIAFKKIDENSFQYQKTILIKEGLYPKEDYKKYRKFRKSIVRFENTRIAFIKK